MTLKQSLEVKALIHFYERNGWDWRLTAEFLLRRYNLSSPYYVIRTAIGIGRGRPRK